MHERDTLTDERWAQLDARPSACSADSHERRGARAGFPITIGPRNRRRRSAGARQGAAERAGAGPRGRSA